MVGSELGRGLPVDCVEIEKWKGAQVELKGKCPGPDRRKCRGKEHFRGTEPGEVKNRDEKCKCEVDLDALLFLLPGGGGIAAATGSDVQQEEQQEVVRSAPGSAQETALVGNHRQKVS